MKSTDTEQLIQAIKHCQLGDDTLRNTLIEQYLPFIIKTCSQHLNRYIQVENNDELIIAMIAFNEAISKYKPEKGNFITFAALLIKNRLIDFQRTGDKEIILSYDDPSSMIQNYIPSKGNIEEELINDDQIRRYEVSLKRFGLSFESLIDAAPKHKKTRFTAIHIGKRSSQESQIVEKLYSTKRLPITLISNSFKVTIKIIKGSKAFITSVIIAYVEKFETITNWIDRTLKDEDNV